MATGTRVGHHCPSGAGHMHQPQWPGPGLPGPRRHRSSSGRRCRLRAGRVSQDQELGQVGVRRGIRGCRNRRGRRLHSGHTYTVHGGLTGYMDHRRHTHSGRCLHTSRMCHGDPSGHWVQGHRRAHRDHSCLMQRSGRAHTGHRGPRRPRCPRRLRHTGHKGRLCCMHHRLRTYRRGHSGPRRLSGHRGSTVCKGYMGP